MFAPKNQVAMFLSYQYAYTEETDFQTAVAQLMQTLSRWEHIVRIVFFGRPTDNADYLLQRNCISKTLSKAFQEKTPAYSYVAQPVLGAGTLAAEIQVLEDAQDAVWQYSTSDGFPYVTVSHAKARYLFTSNFLAPDLSAPTGVQASEVVEKIATLLAKEGFQVSDIVRQWNYLERITGFDADGQQRYQAFNDARSRFYGEAFLANGYPAATGIGTQWGGIQVGLDAIEQAHQHSLRVANPHQRAAYEYSSDVLVGETHKTTPKFERARFVRQASGGWMYISGTAAIRGEATLGSSVLEQVELTLDNIHVLLDASTLQAYGVGGRSQLKSFRVYVKNVEDYLSVKAHLDALYPALPIVYVQADVCRDNLLVEIEGLAEITERNEN